MTQLPSQYEPKAVEEKWNRKWLEDGLFAAEDSSDKKPYSIVIPPPNVTGVLHIGHALNNTLQDILIRYKRMDGFNSMWMPGSDHAGIATQNVVEKALDKEGIHRSELGREKFVERVWEWKEEYGGKIQGQLKKLGASCDWDRERFTMDEGLSKAVREVFVTLYDEGLIYQGEYLINWCPRCHTALSDLEVEYNERQGHMWHIEYPVVGTGKKFVIATTRPETMLGDTAVAVNPEDERYKDLIGKEVALPLKFRKIPIIADEYVDMSFGSGALKVTPAHDPNDFLLGEKHSLEMISILDGDAKINEAGAPYTGLDRYDARKKIVADLEENGLLVKVEEHTHSVGSCYRCHTVVEPGISNQWFVKIKPLAEPAIRAVENGDVKFVPKHWENTYFEWMNNIRDWCISRQIWWGHRIPAWVCDECGELMVLREDPDRCVKCGHQSLTQETDVLDTWFSSALWPFSTLGWPENTDALKTFYPTSVLVTSFDIIFFWVARMMMMGLKFTGKAPFAEVYIHALVRDENGRKMSKSKGNTIDPLEIMENYGTDAMRLTLTALAAQGRDIKLAEERIEGYRNFVNKLWNASRFALMNLEGFDTNSPLPKGNLDLADRWILSRLNRTNMAVRKAFDDYRFNEVAHELYRFTWHEFCDWYLEMIKPRLYGKEPGGDVARAVLAHTLRATLKMLSPVMPFVTEELWQKVSPDGGALALAEYPVPDTSLIDDKTENDMKLVMEVTTAIRNVRGELGVKPSTILSTFMMVKDNPGAKETLQRQLPFIEKLANIAGRLTEEPSDKPENTAVAVAGGVELYVDLEGLVDAGERRAKIEKELGKLEKEIAIFEKKLGNERFVANAPPEVVENARGKLEKAKAEAEKLKGHL